MGAQRVVEMGPALPRVLGIQTKDVRPNLDRGSLPANKKNSLYSKGSISFKNSCIEQLKGRR